ncbi:MAG TPA: amidohydrolase family protein, partial [Anaerolineae bacterium]|nr:amidohydrolase family protein [Anaerolineae bacterium]
MTVLDAHTHMSGSPHDFLAMMDASGVDRALVFTLDGLYVDPAPYNDRLAEFCAADPVRLIPFCSVHPRYPGAVPELRRCVTQLGMRGLKLHPWAQCLSLLDSSLDGIGQELERFNVPVVFHDGTPPNSSPLQIAEFARRHARVPVILGHGGLHDLWKEAVYAAERYPNIYLTPSSMPMHGFRW